MDQQDARIANSLVGRTITRARWFDESPEDDWTHHETCWLWLDDGRVVEFSSYGHDTDGATIAEIEVRDIDRCGHCGKPHPDSQVHPVEPSDVLRHPQLTEGGRHTFCTDGNHRSWSGPSVGVLSG